MIKVFLIVTEACHIMQDMERFNDMMVGWCTLGCSEKGYRQKILTATPPSPPDNHIIEVQTHKTVWNGPKSLRLELD